ncbi:hypothetical protein GKQ38_03570 [Candidatus Nanohaloarchaea archaeon]|nr:hypothetical protein GKQ38_03570 [Candidatus Nanohaloarchaea archaeon]
MEKFMLITALIAGIVAGGLSAELISGNSQEMKAGYCDTLETNIMQNKSFKGTVDCFTPEQVETDLPEKVNESAELKCVCRKSYNGSVRWWNIAVSN